MFLVWLSRARHPFGQIREGTKLTRSKDKDKVGDDAGCRWAGGGEGELIRTTETSVVLVSLHSITASVGRCVLLGAAGGCTARLLVHGADEERVEATVDWPRSWAAAVSGHTFTPTSPLSHSTSR